MRNGLKFGFLSMPLYILSIVLLLFCLLVQIFKSIKFHKTFRKGFETYVPILIICVNAFEICEQTLCSCLQKHVFQFCAFVKFVPKKMIFYRRWPKVFVKYNFKDAIGINCDLFVYMKVIVVDIQTCMRKLLIQMYYQQ